MNPGVQILTQSFSFLKGGTRSTGDQGTTGGRRTQGCEGEEDHEAGGLWQTQIGQNIKTDIPVKPSSTSNHPGPRIVKF